MSEKAPLSLEDPVSKEVLQKFQEIESAQLALGKELLRLEKRRVFLLASSKRLDDEFDRLFGSLLIERGLDPTVPVELDAATGMLRATGPEPEPEPEGQEEAVEEG